MLHPHPSTKLSVPVEYLLLDLLEQGLDVELRVIGTSMAPFIRNQDLVTLAPLDHRTLRLGDIVAFQRPNSHWALHRIVKLSTDSVLMRGDATTKDDGWIPRRDLSARLTRIERQGRHVRLGLGHERTVIAWLSGHGLLAPTLRPLRWLLRRRG